MTRIPLIVAQMATNKLLACPPQLRSVQHYLKLAVDYEAREPVITYWARLYSLQSALKIDKKSPEARTLLANLMDWLETFKKSNLDNESITSDMAGQAVLENEAAKLFAWADSNDRAGVFNKNVVKSFYTTGVLLDVCEVFGELSEEEAAQRKYAKWKATYIHNCLKEGTTPIPGPIGEDGEPTFDQQSDTLQDGNVPAGPDHASSFVNVPSNSFPDAPPSSVPAMTPVDASSPAHHPLQASGGDGVAVGVLPPATFKLARKYCKWADSALDFEDVPTAVDNLTKALALLQPN